MFCNFKVLLALFLSSTYVMAEMDFTDMDRYTKSHCLEALAEIPEGELWDEFLLVQTELTYDDEANFYTNEPFWKSANSVIDLGTGNGSYLQKLSGDFIEKDFLGLDISSDHIRNANDRFNSPNIAFQEGNVETLSKEFSSKYDAAICRFVLEHLKDPHQAVENAFKYLKPGGYLIILDAFDEGLRLSHPVPSFTILSINTILLMKVKIKGIEK